MVTDVASSLIRLSGLQWRRGGLSESFSMWGVRLVLCVQCGKWISSRCAGLRGVTLRTLCLMEISREWWRGSGAGIAVIEQSGNSKRIYM